MNQQKALRRVAARAICAGILVLLPAVSARHAHAQTAPTASLPDPDIDAIWSSESGLGV